MSSSPVSLAEAIGDICSERFADEHRRQSIELAMTGLLEKTSAAIRLAKERSNRSYRDKLAQSGVWADLGQLYSDLANDLEIEEAEEISALINDPVSWWTKSAGGITNADKKTAAAKICAALVSLSGITLAEARSELAPSDVKYWGCSRNGMAKHIFGVGSRDTVDSWLRDPDFEARVAFLVTQYRPFLNTKSF